MIFPIDKVWDHYQNKYKAINIAALYARRVKDKQLQGLIDKAVNPIKEALFECSGGKIKYKE
jgi:DNA-directed RNA polymerase subunit K/omega